MSFLFEIRSFKRDVVVLLQHARSSGVGMGGGGGEEEEEEGAREEGVGIEQKRTSGKAAQKNGDM